MPSLPCYKQEDRAASLSAFPLLQVPAAQVIRSCSENGYPGRESHVYSFALAKRPPSGTKPNSKTSLHQEERRRREERRRYE